MIFQGAQSWDKLGHAEKQEPGQGAVTSQKISRRAQIGGPVGYSPLSLLSPSDTVEAPPALLRSSPALGPGIPRF